MKKREGSEDRKHHREKSRERTRDEKNRSRSRSKNRDKERQKDKGEVTFKLNQRRKTGGTVEPRIEQ